MKKWKKTWIAGLLCAAAICACTAVPVFAVEQSDTIRIGLYYGSDALSAANLLNSVGEGYYLGYTDENGAFCALAKTETAAITMLKTQNMYYAGSGSYTESDNGGKAVGCYHVEVAQNCGSFEEAKAIAAQYSGGFPAWIKGGYSARVGAYTTRSAAVQAAEQLGYSEENVIGTSSYGINIVGSSTADILFQFDGGASLPLTVRPGLDAAEKPVTWFKGYKYYGDFRYERINGGDLTVVNLVDMEDYIDCVISQEMSETWPVEALKAQAVCARTYAEVYRNKHASYHFDLCATTDCQAYIGMKRTSENTQTAAAETAGICVWYQGELAETFYYSSNGGSTEGTKNVWGRKDLPYLQGIIDTYEISIADQIDQAYGSSRDYQWTITYTKAELAQKLRDKGYQCADIVNFYVSETSPTGNVVTLTFVDSAGKSYSFSGEKYIRTMMGAPSFHYTVSGGGKYYVDASGDLLTSLSNIFTIGTGGAKARLSGDTLPYMITSTGQVEQLPDSSSDRFTLTGSGWGHNVGMSQWGAYAMAKQGKTYDEILHFYFTGIELD